jgi:hypothetical protein
LHGTTVIMVSLLLLNFERTASWNISNKLSLGWVQNIKMDVLSGQFRQLCLLLAHSWFMYHCIGMNRVVMPWHFGLLQFVTQFGFTTVFQME